MITRNKLLISSAVVLTLLIAACGGEKDAYEHGTKEEEGEATNEEEVRDTMETDDIEEELSCGEDNSIDLETEEMESSFHLKSVIAYRSGVNLNSGKHARRIVVTFSNKDVSLGRFEVEGTGVKDEWIVQVAFTGPVNGKDDPLIPVSEGVFDAATELAEEQGVSAKVMNANRELQKFKSTDAISGTGEVTGISANRICGTVHLEDASGLVVDASFSAPIVKDYWEHLASR